MDNLKNDQYFVGKIQEDLAFIIKHMKKLEKYDYSKPIKIIQYRSPWFDILFYSTILSLLLFFISLNRDFSFKKNSLSSL